RSTELAMLPPWSAVVTASLLIELLCAACPTPNGVASQALRYTGGRGRKGLALSGWRLPTIHRGIVAGSSSDWTQVGLICSGHVGRLHGSRMHDESLLYRRARGLSRGRAPLRAEGDRAFCLSVGRGGRIPAYALSQGGRDRPFGARIP